MRSRTSEERAYQHVRAPQSAEDAARIAATAISAIRFGQGGRRERFPCREGFHGHDPLSDDAQWGGQTQRAIDNFPVVEDALPRRFIEALGIFKCAAARAKLGFVDARCAEAIGAAAEEVIAGTLDDDLPLDNFRTGSGTSTNMNANEVLATRAGEILGELRGSRLVHPNGHVNNGHSSNDVLPTAMHLSALMAIRDDLKADLVRVLTPCRRKPRCSLPW